MAEGYQLVDRLMFATGFAGRIGIASSMFKSPVVAIVTSACSNCVSIDDAEDLGIGHVAVLSWRATAELLLQLVAGRRTESADRIRSDLAR